MQSKSTRRMVGMAILIAVTVGLQVVASYIRFGPFSITLALIPIVIGAAMYGAKAGAVLGGAFGVVVLVFTITGVDVGAHILWAANPALTAVLCVGKGVLAGLAAGLVYSALANANRTLGTICAAIVCPIVNTSIFLAAMALFYREILAAWAGDTPLLYYTLIGLTGVNFLLEFGVNAVLASTVVRIIAVVKKA